MCVILVNMKTITTREAQHHLSKVLDMVDKGETVLITRRGKKSYKLQAFQDADLRNRKVDWAAEIDSIERELGHLPKFADSTTDLLRADERY